jgi:hypothetical protein
VLKNRVPLVLVSILKRMVVSYDGSDNNGKSLVLLTFFLLKSVLQYSVALPGISLNFQKKENRSFLLQQL